MMPFSLAKTALISLLDGMLQASPTVHHSKASAQPA